MTLITKKCQLRPYLTLYVQSLQGALLTKATPTNYTIRYDFSCHINERGTLKTCLTNHKGSISHHITLLVINSFGGEHTHTDTHAHTHTHARTHARTHTSTQTSWTKAISRNQLCASQRPSCDWFKNH